MQYGKEYPLLTFVSSQKGKKRRGQCLTLWKFFVEFSIVDMIARVKTRLHTGESSCKVWFRPYLVYLCHFLQYVISLSHCALHMFPIFYFSPVGTLHLLHFEAHPSLWILTTCFYNIYIAPSFCFLSAHFFLHVGVK